jgi:hypothetical protein
VPTFRHLHGQLTASGGVTGADRVETSGVGRGNETAITVMLAGRPERWRCGWLWVWACWLLFAGLYHFSTRRRSGVEGGGSNAVRGESTREGRRQRREAAELFPCNFTGSGLQRLIACVFLLELGVRSSGLCSTKDGRRAQARIAGTIDMTAWLPPASENAGHGLANFKAWRLNRTVNTTINNGPETSGQTALPVSPNLGGDGSPEAPSMVVPVGLPVPPFPRYPTNAGMWSPIPSSSRATGILIARECPCPSSGGH